MTCYKAEDLFTLHESTVVAGTPDWMNLRARIRPEWRGEPEDLTGPGIYGVFLEDSLFYIGLYAGKAQRPFGGSVLERWHKHATHHTLRAPGIVFARSQLDQIIDALTDGPAVDIKHCAGAGGDRDTSPLVERNGGNCTFNKARFAARHWEKLGPGTEAALLGRLSFVYHRLPRDLAVRVTPGETETASGWVKRTWLRAAEKQLIRDCAPICNAETVPGTEIEGTGPEEFSRRVAALLDLLAQPGVAPVEAVTSPADEREDADTDLSFGERHFRERLSPEGVALLDELDQRCPRGMSFGFTDTPDLRLYANQPRRRVLATLSPRKNGVLSCETLASAAACRAIGFDTEVLASGTMATRFVFDPALHDLTELVAVAGAAGQALPE